MAIIECPECKKQVSDSADACPNCGFAVKAYVQKQRAIEKIKVEAEQEAIAYVEKRRKEKEAAQKRAEKERVLQKIRSYDKAVELFNKHTVSEVKEAGLLFQALNGWEKSNDYLLQLDERIDTVQQEEKQKQLSRKRIKRISIISVVSILVIISVVFSTITFVIPYVKYSNAIDTYSSGKYIEACNEFLSLNDYKDSDKWFIKSVAALNKHNIACDSSKIIAITQEGTLITSESVYYLENVESLSYDSGYLFTLNKYGKVSKFYDGVWCDKWNDIIYVASGGNKVVAIKKDGNLQTDWSSKEGYYDLITINQWTDIAMVSLGKHHSVGLKSDGTVVSDGNNDSNQCDVGKWENIVSVSAGWNHTVGLRTDGTVVATGNNDEGQCNTENWQDIIAVVAGNNFSVGLKSDGTLVATGNNDANQCNISELKNIVEIAVGYNKTVGLTKDGKVITTSKSEELIKTISEWDNINTVKAPIPDQYEVEPTRKTTKPQTEETTQPTTEETTQAPTQPTTKAPSLYEPEGKPISIEDMVADLDDDEGYGYSKPQSTDWDNTYDFNIKKNLSFEIAKTQSIGENAGVNTLLMESDLPIKSDGQGYCIAVSDGIKYYNITFTFYKNGVVIDGLDGLDNENDCNGFYAYQTIFVRG